MRPGIATVSSLKWSLGLSLLIHAVVAGGVVWYGLVQKASARIEVEDNVTLELIAAPASADEPVAAATAPQPVAPPPVAEPPPVVPPKPPEPALPETTVPKTVVVSQTPTPPEAVVPVEVAKVAMAVPQTPRLQPETTTRADGSSIVPGRDATTAEGKPTAKAHTKYLKNPEPLYPAAARRRRQEGQVLLAVRVEASGRPASVTVKQTSGVPSLDAAAVAAVREWQFEPARIGSVAVESEIEVPVQFKMRE